MNNGGGLATISQDEVREMKGIVEQAISTIRIMAVLVGDGSKPEACIKGKEFLENLRGVHGLLLSWPDITLEILNVMLFDAETQKGSLVTIKGKLRHVAIEPLRAAYGVLLTTWKDNPLVPSQKNELDSKLKALGEKESGYLESVKLHRKYLGEAIARLLLYATKDPTKPNEEARPAFDFILKEVGA
jgi:hypothetical protein